MTERKLLAFSLVVMVGMAAISGVGTYGLLSDSESLLITVSGNVAGNTEGAPPQSAGNVVPTQSDPTEGINNTTVDDTESSTSDPTDRTTTDGETTHTMTKTSTTGETDATDSGTPTAGNAASGDTTTTLLGSSPTMQAPGRNVS